MIKCWVEKERELPSKEKSWFIIIGLLVCLVFAYGCDDTKKMADRKATLETLAEQYWTKRLVEKDFKFTYDLELEKDSMPLSDYMDKVKRKEQIKVSSVKTREVRIDGGRAEVILTVKATVPMVPREVDMALQDLWLLKSNEWRHQFLPQ